MLNWILSLIVTVSLAAGNFGDSLTTVIETPTESVQLLTTITPTPTPKPETACKYFVLIGTDGTQLWVRRNVDFGDTCQLPERLKHDAYLQDLLPGFDWTGKWQTTCRFPSQGLKKDQ